MSPKTIAVGAACLAAAGAFWYARGKAEVPPNDKELRAEIERLRKEVRSVDAAQRAARQPSSMPAAAISAATAAANLPAPAASTEGVPPAPLDPVEWMNERQRASEEAINRIGDELDALLVSEEIDAGWRLQMLPRALVDGRARGLSDGHHGGRASTRAA